MQAWFNTKEEAIKDYEEEIANGKYIPYPPRKDITTGMWSSEPEWGLSAYGFDDEKTFNDAMNEIKEIAWHHKDNNHQNLILFRSKEYIIGDGFDGEDVFKNPDKYWYIEPNVTYKEIKNMTNQLNESHSLNKKPKRLNQH